MKRRLTAVALTALMAVSSMGMMAHAEDLAGFKIDPAGRL